MGATAPSVVITGVGCLSPWGGLEEVWRRLLSGEAGFEEIDPPPSGPDGPHLWARVHDREIRASLPGRRYRRLPRYSRMALAASALCLEEAAIRLRPRSDDARRVGIFIGTSGGSLEATESLTLDLARGRPPRAGAMHFQETVANAAVGHLSIQHGITGPGIALVTGTASGLLALEIALLQLDSGRIDRALVGGIDTLTDLYYQAMTDLRVLSPGDGSREESAPFASERSGLVLSEGAVFLALESRTSCLSRGATPLAEVVSIASVSDGFSFYGNDPEGRGFQRAMELCLARAEVPPSEVDLVLAAASGQRDLDRAEWRGIERAWQGAAKAVPVTAIKGVTGEMGAPTSLLAMAIGTRILACGLIPPVALDRPLDPGCGIAVVRGRPRRGRVRCALVNEASWGGVNVTALLRQPEAAS